MKTQTAIDWLMEQITHEMGGGRYASYIESVNLQEFFEKAKEMEREQIMNALVDGRIQYRDKEIVAAAQYYINTYGGEK